MASSLNKATDNFDSRKSEMYSKVDNMGDHWKGEDYELLNSSTHNYEVKEKDIIPICKQYIDALQKEGITN